MLWKWNVNVIFILHTPNVQLSESKNHLMASKIVKILTVYIFPYNVGL